MKKIVLLFLVILMTGCGKDPVDPPVQPPVITRQPTSQEVALGETVFLEISVEGEGVNCQWYKNGTLIPDATAEKFTIKIAQLSDGGSFSCKVSNEGGSITSDIATIEVDYSLFQGGVEKTALRRGIWRLRVSPLSNNEIEIEFYNPTTKQYIILRWKGGTSVGSKEPLEFISSLAEGNETVAVPTSFEVIQFFGGLCYIKFNADNKVWEGVVPMSSI
jgi:hypothetical protein